MTYVIERDSSVLMHHGILGQKWGIRRYQNSDGTLTAAGKKHYGANAQSIDDAARAKNGISKKYDEAIQNSKAQRERINSALKELGHIEDAIESSSEENEMKLLSTVENNLSTSETANVIRKMSGLRDADKYANEYERLSKEIGDANDKLNVSEKYDYEYQTKAIDQYIKALKGEQVSWFDVDKISAGEKAVAEYTMNNRRNKTEEST